MQGTFPHVKTLKLNYIYMVSLSFKWEYSQAARDKDVKLLGVGIYSVITGPIHSSSGLWSLVDSNNYGICIYRFPDSSNFLIILL